MSASSGRLLYECVFWIIVGSLIYINRHLYTVAENTIAPLAQAYTPVVLVVIGLVLFLLVNYLREAIAATIIGFFQRAAGGRPLDFEKGSYSSNIQRSARRLARKGEFQGAGEAYESLELWRDAAQMYERGNMNSRAAACWEQAQNPGKAIELYEKDGRFEAAGALCQKEGLQDRAIRNYRFAAERYLDQNQFDIAAEYFEKAGEYEKSAHCFEQAQKPDKALACYERSGNTGKILALVRQVPKAEYLRRGPDFSYVIQRSAEVLFQNGHGAEAAQIMEDCHNLTRAAELWASTNRWDKAAELYMKAEQLEMAEHAAAKIPDEKTSSEVAARLAIAKGDWSAAGEQFEAAGKQGQAIDAYKKARNFEAAARIYEAMGRFIMAGEMYSSSKKFTAAANAYAKAYDWRNAAECFETSGDLAQAVEAYANAGNYLKAGILASKLTDYARAVEYLQRIPPGAPDFQVGTAYLATAFYYQGQHDMARELFERVMHDLPINRETLPPYYTYATQLEPGDPKKSLGLFRQILGVDVHYSDVSDHVHKLEKIVTSMSTGYGKTPVPETFSIKTITPLTAHMSPADAGKGTSVTASKNEQQGRFYRTNEDGNLQRSTISRPNATANSGLLEDRYQLQSEISQHGRVVDHLGVDTTSGAQVIVRTFPCPNDVAVHQATTEMLSTVSNLSHPNINRVLRFGETGDLVFTVSSLCDGDTLRNRIRGRGPLSVTEVQLVSTQLLEALGYAHSQEICHLNLRPDVVYVQEDGGRRAILSGFGMPVRQPQNQEPVYLTLPDSDPQYLAPEQIIGTDIDCRTDIYAFGLLLFFMLTGRTPFEVKRVNDTQEIARMQVQVSLPRPSNIRATLPSSIDDIFMKCVNKSVLSRYQTVSDLLTDLQGVQTSSFT